MYKKDALISDFIKEYLSNTNAENKFAEIEAINYFYSICGKLVSSKIKKADFKNAKLFIKTDSAVIKNELIIAKKTLIDAVNKKFGDGFLKEIIMS